VVRWTRPGLERWRDASDEQITDTFVRYCQKSEGSAKPPAWSLPETAARAKELMRAYGNATDSKGNERMQLAARYEREFGRELRTDLDDYAQLHQVLKEHANMKTNTEGEWIKSFANLGKEQGFNPGKFIGTISEIAGVDNTQVEAMSLQGDRVHLVATDPRLTEKKTKDGGLSVEDLERKVKNMTSVPGTKITDEK